MASALEKLVTLSKLGVFKEETDKAYVAQAEGQGLYPDTDKSKLEGVEAGAEVNVIEKITVNGTEATIDPASKTAKIDVEAIIEGDGFVNDDELTTKLADYAKSQDVADTYLKSEDASSTYLTQTTAESTYAKATDLSAVQEKIGKIGEVKGATTKEELSTLEPEPNKGDIYIATDDENHLFMFVGQEQPGADENGFVDLGNHIDLSGYVKSENLTEASDEDIRGLFVKA